MRTKKAIQDTHAFLNLLGDGVGYVGVSTDYIRNLKSLSLVGCGTSWHAARIARFILSKYATCLRVRLSVTEFRYKIFHGIIVYM